MRDASQARSDYRAVELDAPETASESVVLPSEAPDPVWDLALSEDTESDVRPYRVLVDLIAVLCAIVLSIIGRFYFQWLAVNADVPSGITSHVVASGVWCAAFLVAAASQQLYDEDTIRPEGGEFPRLVRAALEAAAVLSIFVYFSHSLAVSRSWFGMLVVFTLVFVVVCRNLFTRLVQRRRTKGLHQRPVIVVADAGSAWPEELFRDAPEFRQLARLTKEQTRQYLEELGKQLLSGSSRKKRRSPTLLLKSGDFSEEELWQLIMDAGLVHCPVFVHSDVRAVGGHRLLVREVGNSTVVKIAPPRLSGMQAVTKRAFDLIVSSILLVLLSPLLILISLLILATMGWPVFFVQERAGKDGVPFKMIKFRTMRRDAEQPDQPVRAIKDDPRRTKLGTILRRASLDELPQLFNVLKGDMSLVGPRPEMALIASGFEQEIRFYGYRHRIRPGITGWAQAHGYRGDTSIPDRVHFDNWYIEHWSLALDLRIMGRTLGELLRGENAY